MYQFSNVAMILPVHLYTVILFCYIDKLIFSAPSVISPIS